MPPRSSWKGVLKLAELTCQVSLFPATSTAERLAFHLLNRKTGHRLHRQWVDAETAAVVPNDNLIKGYDTGNGQYVVITPEEIASATPEGDKTLEIFCFVKCDEVDPIYFDRPYYLAPVGDIATDAFALLRETMRGKNLAGIARAVLFRKLRTILLRPADRGMVATLLNFDYELRAEDEVFARIPEIKIDGEMLDLAQHIIATKHGVFNPTAMGDRYETALAELVTAKLEGRKIASPKRHPAGQVLDLMAALKQSAKKSAGLPKPARKSAQRQ